MSNVRLLKPMPSVTLNLEMKSTSDGGRTGPFKEGYKPHLVVSGKEDYLGVCLIDCPQWVHPGTNTNVKFSLVYHPSVNYDVLNIGSNVEVREGGKIVGFGKIIALSA